MPKFLTQFSLIALLAFAAPLTAQENSDAEAPAAEDTPAAVPEELPTGETAPEEPTEPQIGQTYLREMSGDWELRCVRTENPENDPCQLYQLLKEDNGNPISEISLFRLADGAKLPAGATIIVPLETLLTGQLGIAVDGGKPKSYPYSFCNKIGCYARIGLSDADIAAFKRGAKAKVMLRPFKAPDQIVSTTMSLKGFTAGYDMVTRINQP